MLQQTHVDTRVDPRELDRAIARGVDALARAAGPDHLWRDFFHADGSGGSDEWVSGFIAAHVASVPQARPLAAATARALLSRARASGGWGYRPGVLEDCDSTAWVLLAAARCGVALPRELAARSLRFLGRHQVASGGFVTYGTDGPAVFGAAARREGWFTAQPCVTAAALLLLARAGFRDAAPGRQAAAYLLARRDDDGLWRPYWWHGPAYGTCHAALALQAARALSSGVADELRRRLVAVQLEDGGWSGARPDRANGFATALSLLTLLAVDARHDARASLLRGARRLLAWQRADGLFPGSAELLVPGGRDGETITLVDRGLFTTACALHALETLRADTR